VNTKRRVLQNNNIKTAVNLELTLFVWSGVVDGALLRGHPRRLASVDARCRTHTVTTSRSTSGQHTVLRRRGCQRRHLPTWYQDPLGLHGQLLPGSTQSLGVT
jgi:hypothetical protein